MKLKDFLRVQDENTRSEKQAHVLTNLLYRKYQTNSCTGPENASNSPLTTGPSPATSRDSVSILQTTADVGKYEIPYTTQRDAHLLNHITTRNQAHNS
ncbi:hypothetical protein AVEN_199239-1 [Araneus ventricosus]|uniref:Uncharacterized protein n=1 Tax=Araneus ventricosus TaxID=182803 RepID=A0A4Y2VGA3_ARAVE|nr:hypothetical protein AVEN_199239-1 [Araneus ventricosus]